MTNITVKWTREGENQHQIDCVADGDTGRDDTTVSDTATATCKNLTQGTLYTVTIEAVKDGFAMEDCQAECTTKSVTSKFMKGRLIRTSTLC